MPWNGSGTFSLTDPPINFQASPISSADMNSKHADFVAGLNNTITRDGQASALTSTITKATQAFLFNGSTSQRATLGNIMSLGVLTRAEAAALTVTSGITVLGCYHGGVLTLFEKDASGTALTTADGQNWSPVSGMPATPQHWELTTAGHQACWDHAHTTGQAVLLAADITVVATEYWGNLTLIAGGGTINITGDASFAISAGGGPRASEGCIIMRGANANTDYGEAFDTQYSFKCIGRVPIIYTRTSTAAPRGAVLFSGLKEGSVVDFDCITHNSVAGTGAGTNARPIAFYFYNRCTVRGRYEIVKQDVGQLGGLWLQHVAIGGTGTANKSIFHLEDLEAKHNGEDEVCAIFTTGYPAGGARGFIHASGSITCYSDYAVGFGVLNNSLEDAEGFSVNLESIVVYANNLQQGSTGCKFRSAHGQVGSVTVFMQNAAAGATTVRGLGFEDVDGIGSRLQVGSAKVIITGVLDCGDNIVNMVEGPAAEIQHLVTAYMSGATVPKHSVSGGGKLVIHGGDIVSGQTGALINVYKITGGIVRGLILSTLHVGEDVTVFWDTDAFGTHIYNNTAASIPTTFPETRTVYFKPRIIASGTATPTRTVTSNWANVNHDIDYWLDYRDAGGAPSSADTWGSARGEFRYVLADAIFTPRFRDEKLQFAQSVFTPSLTFDGAASGMTYSARSGKYHIQDGILFFDADITLSAKGASTGGAALTLPSTAQGVSFTPTPDEGAVVVKQYSNMTALASPMLARVETSFAASRVRLFTGTATVTGAVTEANFTDTSRVRISGWVPLY